MNVKFSNLVQQTCTDEVYINSLHDFLQSKLNSLAYTNSILAKAINEEELTEDERNHVFECDGGYYQVQNLVNSLSMGTEAVLPVSGSVPTYIENIFDKVQENYITADLICQSLSDNVLTGTGDAGSKAILLMNRINNKYNNISGNAKQLLDQVASIAGNEAMTVRDKVANIWHLVDPSLSDAATYDDFDSETQSSYLSQCTGINPLKSIGLAIHDFVSETIDLSTIKTAVVSGCNAIKTAFNKGWNWLRDNGGTVCANIARTTTETLSITNTDWKNLEGGDGTVDNAFMVFDGTLDTFYTSMYRHNVGDYNPLWQYGTSYHGETTSWRDIIKDQMPTMQLNIWYRFDFPGSHVYFSIYGSDEFPTSADWSGSDLKVKMVVKFRPIDIKCITAIGSSTATAIADLVCDGANISATFDPTLDQNFYTYDNYMFTCCQVGKGMTNFVGNSVLTDDIEKDYDAIYTSRAELSAAIILPGAVSGQGFNPTFSGHKVTIAGVDYDDPTNLDFCKLLSGLSDSLIGNDFQWSLLQGSYSPSSTAISNFIAGILAMIFSSYVSQETVDDFTPYMKTGTIAQGSYYIRSDKDNVNKVLTRTAAVVGIIAVTAATIAGARLIRDIKMKAVTSNLEASTIQSSIQQKLASGTAISKSELNSCYVATRKAVRLNKLSGGFASITTGLSTWGTSGTFIPNLTSDNQDILKAITG